MAIRMSAVKITSVQAGRKERAARSRKVPPIVITAEGWNLAARNICTYSNEAVTMKKLT